MDVAIRALPLLLVGLFLAAWYGFLDTRAPLPAATMRPLQGNGYYVDPLSTLLPNPCMRHFLCPATGDSNAAPRRSSLLLLEYGIPLGPAHTDHQEINERGGGRYSH